MKNRIRELRKNQRLSQNELSSIVGVAQTTLSYWELGKYEPDQKSLQIMADYFNVSIDYLIGAAPETDYSAYGINPISKKRLPMLGDIACGEPIYTNEEHEFFVEVGTDIKADFTLRAKGDSMIGSGICDGAIVFIRQQDMVENGEVAAVIIGDQATLKRVYYYPSENRLILNADNPAYPPISFCNEELNQIKILGKAIAYQADIK